MTRPPLPSEVLSRYKTDKATGVAGGGHSYGLFYNAHLTRLRWADAVLEVGIAQGESLRAWAEYFPKATVIGLDNVSGRLVNDGRIKSLLLDCSDPYALTLFADEYRGRFSLVVDDGSHRLADQLLAARVLKRAVKAGGLLVIEDIESAEYADLFRDEGFALWEGDRRRHDDRIAYWYKPETQNGEG